MHSKKISWLVVFNSNACRIFNYQKKPKALSLITEFSHAENRLRDFDLTSDKPGKYQSNHSTHGTYSQPTDPKEIKIDHFIREIANFLEKNRNLNAYTQLIIVSASHTNGLFHKHINKYIEKLIIHTIEKDLIYQSDQELLNTLTHSEKII